MTTGAVEAAGAGIGVGVGIEAKVGIEGGTTGATAATGGADGNPGGATPTRPASSDKPAKLPAAPAVATANGAVNSGRIIGSSTKDCSIIVLTNAMVSVIIVPMASMVVNSRVKPIVTGLPEANAAARSAPIKAKVWDK